MAFGGHYLSDVLLGGLVTLIIVEIARMLLWPRGGDPSAPEPGASTACKGGQTAAEVVEAARFPLRDRRPPGADSGQLRQRA